MIMIQFVSRSGDISEFLKTRALRSLDFMAQVPSGLRRFISNGLFMKSFPRWINPSLSCLTVLSIRQFGVCVLPEHLDKLAQLPSLRFLLLCEYARRDEQEKLVVHSDLQPHISQQQNYTSRPFATKRRSGKMDIATGAMNTLLRKLEELVVGEYKLQKGVKGEIKKLEKELRCITAALREVSKVPADQLDEQIKIWAGDARELSYDIEDAVDTFMLHGKGHEHAEPFSLKGLIGKATNLYKKAKTNHQIHNVIKEIMDQVKEVSERRDRNKVDNIAARSTLEPVDPRLEATYRKATELVGIGGPKNELAKRLLGQDCSSRQKAHIISIVGSGGLGKTTLANSLLQDLKANFDCHFFVSVSFNPDIKKVFKNILVQLDEKSYSHIDDAWEIKLLIEKIIEFLKNRRCLCVIDDLWREMPWDTIKLALQDGNHGSKIIITTRNRSVAEHVDGGIYELKPLSNGDSRELFYKRIFDSVDDCPADLSDVTEKILKKCGGVPLAIITTASLLASKPRWLVEWEKVNNSIGSRSENSPHVDKMNTILRLSYNDLPFHLKTCLLSLEKYPEDQVIRKDVLVWSWIAEGFITPAGSTLQETGDAYFIELINRSLIQPVNYKYTFDATREREVYACRTRGCPLVPIFCVVTAMWPFSLDTLVPWWRTSVWF